MAPVARHDGIEVAPEAPGRAAVPAPHLQRVAKALRGDEPDLRALAFEKRVGPGRGAVDHGADAREIVDLPADAVEKAPRLVGPGGGHLGDGGGARGLVEDEDVREGAADIDADHAPRAHLPSSRQAVP